jgi:hypothetical protein
MGGPILAGQSRGLQISHIGQQVVEGHLGVGDLDQHPAGLHARHGEREVAGELGGTLPRVMGTRLQRAQCHQERLLVHGHRVKADQDIARERGDLDAAHPWQRAELSLDAALPVSPPLRQMDAYPTWHGVQQARFLAQRDPHVLRHIPPRSATLMSSVCPPSHPSPQGITRPPISSQ